MARAATFLGTIVLAAAAGFGGAAGYEALFGEDDAPARQAPLTSSVKPANPSDNDEGLTPADIYDKTSPGVVLIQAVVSETVQSPFGDQQREGSSTGTGFVVSKDGFIVTNAHVVQGAKRATVQFGSDTEIPAEVKGIDVNSDLAVIQIDPKDHELTPLELGSTEGIKVGDPVVAIGNPFGLDRTLTTGVVSALARRIEGLNGFTISDVVQTDAAINKGNSGGPLIDAGGRVIGVNSQIQTETGGNVGIGFAVPVERLKQVLPSLEKGEEVKVAFLGVTTIPIDETLKEVGVGADSGLLVVSVEPRTGAQKAGIRAGTGKATIQIDGTDVPLGGDVLRKVDGREFESPTDLADYIGGKKVGDEITIELQRKGKSQTVKVTLGSRPSSLTG